MDTWRKVGLANDRYIHGANINGSLYGKFYRTGNTVGVLLDMDHGTLSFVLDAYGGHTLDRDAVVNMRIAQSNLGKLVGSFWVNCVHLYLDRVFDNVLVVRAAAFVSLAYLPLCCR